MKNIYNIYINCAKQVGGNRTKQKFIIFTNPFIKGLLNNIVMGEFTTNICMYNNRNLKCVHGVKGRSVILS